jgi:hypothetical protein
VLLQKRTNPFDDTNAGTNPSLSLKHPSPRVLDISTSSPSSSDVSSLPYSPQTQAQGLARTLTPGIAQPRTDTRTSDQQSQLAQGGKGANSLATPPAPEYSSKRANSGNTATLTSKWTSSKSENSAKSIRAQSMSTSSLDSGDK